MKKINLASMEGIVGGNQPKCIYVGMGISTLGQTLSQTFGGLGYAIGLGADIYRCWNS